MSVFKSLDNVSAVGPGTATDLKGVYDIHTLQVTVATIPSAGGSVTVASD